MKSLKRMSDITLEGYFDDTVEYRRSEEIDQLFNKAKVGQILNIKTSTKTLRFELVQITQEEK